MDEMWKIAIGMTGISGIGAFVFLSLYKDWIAAPVLSDLTKAQKYKLLRLFLVLTFLFAGLTLLAAAYSKQQDSDPIRLSKNEFYETQQAKYERGKKLLLEKAEDLTLTDAERKEVKKLAADYATNVEEASKALRGAQLSLWYERTKQIHELLQSEAAKKYLPEEVKTWDIARELPLNPNDLERLLENGQPNEVKA